jgi:hypothetical protein
LYYFRSSKECAGYCLADSQCSAFFWNESVAKCQTSSATNLAGDLTSQAVFGYIDKTLKPGVNFINILCVPFWYKSVLPSFSLDAIWLCDFCHKNIGTKAAQKMLMN